VYSYRCLAHIINLATQAVISTCSKSKFYSGNPEDEPIPEDLTAVEHDEIGIVRAICVKVCSLFHQASTLLTYKLVGMFLITTQTVVQVNPASQQP